MIRSVILGISLLSALAVSAVTLESESLRLVFGTPDAGFGLESVVNKLSGETRFGGAFDGATLWSILFSRRGAVTNEYCTVVNGSPVATRESERTEDRLRLYWKGVDLPGDPGAVDVAADVKLLADGASEWRLTIRNRSRVWAQHTVDYPIIRGVLLPGGGAALLPWKNLGGRFFRPFDPRKACQRGEFNVPGTFLPLAAFMRGEAGLYFAAQDGDMRIKKLKVSADADVCFSTLLENAGIVGKAAEGPHYAVTVAAFRGDWWEAAHRYRDWALRQKWCRKGKIAFRKDFPRIAAEADLWPNTGGGYDRMTNRFAQLKAAWPDLRIAVGWSSWYAVPPPGNRMNPEFFPMRDPLVPEAARFGRANGFHLMPYVNGRIWDKSSCGFAYAKADATVDENGEFYEENYGGRFAVMCPWCPNWQTVVRELGVRVLDEVGADMVYFDQVSCSRAKPCFNPAHGHPLGGGTWWTDGYRRMFESIHADFAKRGAAVTSEQLGEAWLDVIDAYLNASEMTDVDVPLFPAIYQGYCVHFGREVGCDKPYQTHAWRFLQDAKTVLWGEAPGWIGPHIYTVLHYADEAENLARVARFRRAHEEFLIYGSLEGEVRTETDDPDVYGTVWKTADGNRTAAMFVNVSSEAKRVNYRFSAEGSWRQVELPPMQLKCETKRD